MQIVDVARLGAAYFPVFAASRSSISAGPAVPQPRSYTTSRSGRDT
jgi:hypothetical protein